MATFALIVAVLALVAACGAAWLNYVLFQKQKKLKAPEPPDLSGLVKHEGLEGLLKQAGFPTWTDLKAYLHQHYPALQHLQSYYASKSYVDNNFAKKSEVPSRDSIIVDPGAVDHLTLNEHRSVLRNLVGAALADLRARLSPIAEDMQQLLLEKQAHADKLQELQSAKDNAEAAAEELRGKQLGTNPSATEMQEFAASMESQGRDAHAEWTDYVVNQRDKVRAQRAAELESAEADVSSATHALFQHQHTGDIDRKTKTLKALKAQHKLLKEAEQKLEADLEKLQPPEEPTDDELIVE